MADGDKITIDQINWDDSNLPKWATEATQLRIAKALGAMDKTDDKELKESKKQSQSLKSVVDQVKEMNKNSSENSKKLIASLNKKGNDYTKDLVKKNLDTPFKSVNNAIKGVAGKFGILGAAVGGIATAIGFVIGQLKQFTDSFRSVFAMGFRFEQGAMGLAKSALAAEMGIQEYTEVLGRFSTAIGVIGTDSFNNLNVALRDNLKTQALLGMSLAELTEYTGDFADQLLGAGILNEINNDQLETMATSYLKNITAFSTLAKVSRDQISATIKASVSVEAFANRLGMLGPVAAERVLKSTQVIAGMFAGLGTEFGDQLATTFTTAYGRGGLFFTEAGRQLLAVNRDLYNSMSGIIADLDTMTEGDAAKAAVDMFEAMENVSDDTRARLGIIERSNTEYAAAARDQIALIRRIENLREEGALEEFKDLKRLREESRIDPLSTAFINFERVIQRFKLTFKTFFTSLFGNQRIFDAIGVALQKFEGKASAITDKILSFAETAGDVLAKWIGALADADSFGEFLATALVVPIRALGNAITDAIVAGWNRIAMDLPWYLGGDGTPNKKFKNDFLEPLQDAEKSKTMSMNNLTMTQAQRDYIDSNIKALRYDGPGKQTNVSGNDIDHLMTIVKNQMNSAKYDVDRLRDEEGGTHDEQYAQDEMYREAFNMFSRAKDNFDMVSVMFNDIKSATDSNTTAALTQTQSALQAEFNKLFPHYDFDASVKAGELVTKADVNAADGTAGDDTNANRATESAIVNPESITASRMRIMNQYLPMTGSADPTMSPEQRYYQATLEKMEIQNQALKEQLQELQKIQQKI